MDKFIIKFEKIEYEYFLFEKTEEIVAILRQHNENNIFIIYDNKINMKALDKLIFINEKDINCKVLSIHVEESGKNLDTIERLGKKLIDLGVSRDSCLIAVGGGILGNVVGLLAGLLFRGIKLVHIPTTLIGCADSVISLKQAVNLDVSKNIIGMYYKPNYICTSAEIIQGLPEREIKSGYVELVKNMLICVPNYINDLLNRKNLDTISYLNLKWILEVSIKAKMMIMRNDKYEKKEGILLEYGHTIGHAIEMLTNGMINHGEGVAIGILVAGEISNTNNGLSNEAIQLQYELLDKIGIIDNIRTQLRKCKIEIDLLIKHIMKDNKRGYIESNDNMIPMVILQDIGKPINTNGKPITLVKKELVERCIAKVIVENGGCII